MVTKTLTEKTIKSADFVVIHRKEYEDLKSRAVPRHYLTGKAAKRLDRLAENGLKEYKAGKTETLDSFLEREYPRLYQKYAR